MKLLTFMNGKEQIGVLSSDRKQVIPISQFGYDWENMNDLIRESTEADLSALAQASGHPAVTYPLEKVKLLAPIPHPVRDIVCMGLNYTDHAAEMAQALKEENKPRTYPIFFGKAVDRARGHGESIPSHKGFISTLDYECELGAILKKDGRNVSPEEVGNYIFGYTIINDVTARELSCHKQNYFMKSLDGTCPMGPWIVTADEIAFPPRLRLRLSVNDELRQNGNTSQMIFGLDVIVSELSRGMTLPAGTIFATGSPTGIGFGMSPPVFLKDGDVIKCEIETIGVLTTMVLDKSN
jgi:2-keto-4-pentenoate hydratase/2-oxohepta-3-ene-1,7-dioic acid hydratase in catechol pathway